MFTCASLRFTNELLMFHVGVTCDLLVYYRCFTDVVHVLIMFKICLTDALLFDLCLTAGLQMLIKFTYDLLMFYFGSTYVSYVLLVRYCSTYVLLMFYCGFTWADV